MPVAYNIPGSGIGVAAAMRCDKDPSYYSGYDSYWVKPPPAPPTPAQNGPSGFRYSSETANRHMNRRSNQPRNVFSAGSRSFARSPSPQRRSVSVTYRPATSFSFPSNDKAVSGSNRLCRMPEYNPFGDPHLIDYFARKFGVLDDYEPSPVFVNRSMSPRRRINQTHVANRGRNMSSSRVLDRTEKQKRSRTSDRSKTRSPQRETLTYKVTLVTGSQTNAGTSADVFIRMKGDLGKMPKFKQLKTTNKMLESNKRGRSGSNQRSPKFFLAPSSKHTFKVKSKDLGELNILYVELDGTDEEDDWFLKEVIVKTVSVNDEVSKWKFPCEKWLSLHRPPDYQLRRKLKVSDVEQHTHTEFQITTKTADKAGAGTTAKVFITLYGEQRSTPRLHLKRKNKRTFDRGQTDTFRVSSDSVGDTINKIKIEHDNTGFSPGWCIEKVVVKDLHQPSKEWFAIPNSAGDMNWLDKQRGDKSTSKMLSCSNDKEKPSVEQNAKYAVRIWTGSKKSAGTDADVFINLYGSEGETGEKSLRKMKSNAFAKSSEDDFMIEAPSIGTLQRVRIGHNNAGIAPGWFLEKLTVEDVATNTVSEFKVSRWLAKNEDDGKIVRDLYTDEKFSLDSSEGGIPYELSIHTGDKGDAGTNAKVYVILHGEKEENGSVQSITSGKVTLDHGSFERGKIDICKIDSIAGLSPLTRLTIGHDNSGLGASWFLDKVVVICPTTGIEQHFVCENWLSDSIGDKLVERELTERASWRKVRKKKIAWNVTVVTNNSVGGGTNAKVLIQLYGEKGKTEAHHLTNENSGSPGALPYTFDAGSTDRFKVPLDDVGKPVKLRVWHDNSGRFPGWHLDTITLTNISNPEEKYSFVCNKWLSVDEDYFETVREIPAAGPGIKAPLPIVAYRLKIQTGKKMGAGTDANVFCTIYGEKGDSGMRKIRRSDDNMNKFERGQVENCIFECVDLGKLVKVRIEHDNKNPGAGWFLDQVSVQPIGSGKATVSEIDDVVIFPCYRWLAVDEDDGQCVRELYPEGVSSLMESLQYKVSVKTGNKTGAATSANVFIHLFGDETDSGVMFLRNSSTSKQDKFQPGRVDTFSFESANIGKVEKVRLGHDDTGIGSGWFVETLEVEIPVRGEAYVFAVNRWLDKEEMDGRIEIDLYPTEVKHTDATVPFEICVTTSDREKAGTDSNAYVVIYGQGGKKTSKIPLENRAGDFDAGVTSSFKFNEPEIGEIKKIRVWHDDSGEKSSWHLEKITITRPPPRKNDLIEEEGLSGTPGRRESAILSTSGRRESAILSTSGRRESAILSTSGRRESTMSVNNSRASFKRNAVSSIKKDLPLFYIFNCNSWLSHDEGDQEIVKEFAPSKPDGKPMYPDCNEMTYECTIKTGLLEGASADVSASLTIYGKDGDSGPRHLKHLPREDKVRMEAGGDGDLFHVKAINLGQLTKVVISLNRQSWNVKWFLDSIEVEILANERVKYIFPCQRWLGLSTEESQTSWTLVPIPHELIQGRVSSQEPTAVRETLALELLSLVTRYTIHVFTGTKSGAGTNADVFIRLHGDNDSSETLWLRHSQTNKDPFESGRCDTFEVEAKDLGNLGKITIGHTGTGPGAGWFLDLVKVEARSEGKLWGFPCARWLAKDEDDGSTERVLHQMPSYFLDFDPWTPYEIKTVTSDMSGAGTDEDIFVCIYGEGICTEEHSLEPDKQKRKKVFNKGQTDAFLLEMVDVRDTVQKLRIGHRNLSSGQGWHLDRVIVRKMTTSLSSITYTFNCNKWLDRGKDDHAIVRELAPSSGFKENLDNKTGKMNVDEIDAASLHEKEYEIFVHTGNVSGAGTDANVFCTLFGENGDSGERKLKDSATHRNKFERGCMDQFSIRAVDLGKLMKLKIRHDDSGFNASWFLDRIEVKDVEKDQMTIFHAERWLSKDKGKGQKIECNLYAKGYEGDRDSFRLSRSLSSSMQSLGSSFRGSDYRLGPERSPRKRSIQEMPMFTEPTVPYTIKIETGPEKDNGTDANGFIIVKGASGKSTGSLPLQLLDKEAFEPSCTDTFSIEAPDVGQVTEITIGHDGVLSAQGWFVKNVEIDMPQSGKNYHFPCGRWMAKDKDDGLLQRTISVMDASATIYKPKRSYELIVETGDRESAGTDCRITLQFFGAKGAAAPITLSKQEDNFERANKDTFQIDMDDIIPFTKLRITLEPAGARTCWYLERITLRDKANMDFCVFNCNNWFDLKRKMMKREVPANVGGKDVISNTSYTVFVKTSDIFMAGTNAKVSLILFGENGDSGTLELKESKTHSDKFSQNNVDEFQFDQLLSLGNLLKVRIWHDNSGLTPSWHLYSVEVLDQNTAKRYRFMCNKWLSNSKDDKMIMRDLLCDSVGREYDSAASTDYEVAVRTTDKKNASSRNHVFIKLVGVRGTSRELYMINKAHERLFRGGDLNKFNFSAENVGKIEAIMIGHIDKVDGQFGIGGGNGDGNSSWHCYDVVVTNLATRDQYTFLVNDWVPLSKDTGKALRVNVHKAEEGLITAMKTLSNVKYQIEVTTGSEKGAGTDANVFIQLFGEVGDSGRQKLTKQFRDLFERGRKDTFTLEFLDLGKLQKLVIEHDNSGFGAAWLLDKVEVTNLTTNEVTCFPCNKWFDKDKGDGLIKRELLPRSQGI